MFDSLPALNDLLLSGGNLWPPEELIEAPLRAGGRLVTPHEPTTLALAAVGIATVAIYLATRGVNRLSSRRALKETQPRRESGQRAAALSTRRGAA